MDVDVDEEYPETRLAAAAPATATVPLAAAVAGQADEAPGEVTDMEDAVASTVGAASAAAEAGDWAAWAWPVVDYSRQPSNSFLAWKPFRPLPPYNVMAGGRTCMPLKCGNFVKTLKWAPDGSCFFTVSDDCAIRVFDLPSNAFFPSTTLATASAAAVAATATATTGHDNIPNKQVQQVKDVAEEGVELSPALSVWEGESVYSACWYPSMSAADPASCVFATSTRDHPIHLWDAVTGELRATYRAYDHMDEITAAYSLAFTPQGDKIIAGYKKTLRVFDVSRPGAQCAQHCTVPQKPRGSKQQQQRGRSHSNAGAVAELMHPLVPNGQPGMISCLGTSEYQPGLVVAGSYDCSVGLYGSDGADIVGTVRGHQGGVTQVMFSPDGNFVYSGARRDPSILCWDVRNFTDPVYCLRRDATSTNQCIGFDIERSGRHLATGGQDGRVVVYDLATAEQVGSFQAAQDTVTASAFHPMGLPLLATASGHRRFILPPNLSNVDEDGSSDDDDDADCYCDVNMEIHGRSAMRHASALAHEVGSWELGLSRFENCAAIWEFNCSSLQLGPAVAQGNPSAA